MASATGVKGFEGKPGVVDALTRRRAEVIERWLAAFAASPLRAPGRSAPELGAAADGIAAALADSLDAGAFAPGAPALREAEKQLAFAGGALGGAGRSASEVLALVVSLRDVLVELAEAPAERDALARLFDWLGAVALEGALASREDALRGRHRDALERGTPLVLVASELPATFLVGDADGLVVQGALGRLLFTIVRVGARAAIVDASALGTAHAPDVLGAVERFASHPRVARVVVVVAGLAGAVREAWAARFPPGIAVVWEERFDDAVTRALAASDRAVGPRRAGDGAGAGGTRSAG